MSTSTDNVYGPIDVVDLRRRLLEQSERGSGSSDNGGEDEAPPPQTPPTPHEIDFSRRPNQLLQSQRRKSEAPCPQSLRGADSLALSAELPGRGGASAVFGFETRRTTVVCPLTTASGSFDLATALFASRTRMYSR